MNNNTNAAKEWTATEATRGVGGCLNIYLLAKPLP